MTRAVQKRTLETRARLVASAEEVIAEAGFEALRVEEVVLRAGTAKGTFFAHFKDKDALMDLIIGARINALLDQMNAGAGPRDVNGLANALMPLCNFLTSERYVYDITLRYSGAAAVEEVGPIAETFGRQIELLMDWLASMPYRQDIPVDLRAEGVHAFMFQAMSVHFCALHNATSIRDRLIPYLNAWLRPDSPG
ncbi:MAG: TetR/AcrR family transcriptional regulator [Paracoccaceae bacterium]